MTAKKSLKEKKSAQLLKLCDKARRAIEEKGLKEVSRQWLSSTLGLSDSEAAQVASQLKKELFFYGENKRSEESFLPTIYRVRQ